MGPRGAGVSKAIHAFVTRDGTAPAAFRKAAHRELGRYNSGSRPTEATWLAAPRCPWPLPAMLTRTVRKILFRRDRQLISYLIRPDDFRCLRPDCRLLVLRVHNTFQCHHPISGDNLNVVRVRGERLISGYTASNALADVEICSTVRLLVCRRRRLCAILLIVARVVRAWALSIRHLCNHDQGGKRQMLQQRFLRHIFHLRERSLRDGIFMIKAVTGPAACFSVQYYIFRV